MSKEKLQNLSKYADVIKNKLSSPLPEKHKGHEVTYKQFLERELKSVTLKIDNLKLQEPSKK